MGAFLYLRCTCGARLADEVSRGFNRALLCDGLDLRAWLEDLPQTPVPLGPCDHDVRIPAKEFADWWETTDALLYSKRALLPVLLEIWLCDPETKQRLWNSDALLTWNDRLYEVVSDRDEVVWLLECSEEVGDALLACIRAKCGAFTVPVLDAAETDLPRARYVEKFVPTLPALWFARVFHGTCFELEAAGLLDFYAHDFEMFQQTALHARACGKPILAHYT
jgi:hypothetical protein